MTFARDKYLNQLIKSKENGFPKVITGIRRCGKSYLLDKIYREYLEKNGVNPGNIIYIDLEDALNYKYWDPLYLYDYVLDISKDKNGVVYVIIDEIQHVYKILNPNLTNGEHVKANDNDEDVISFVNVVLGLSKKKNLDVYVTGSNSKMLSSDIATELRNKETEIKIEPLSFKEFLDAPFQFICDFTDLLGIFVFSHFRPPYFSNSILKLTYFPPESSSRMTAS